MSVTELTIESTFPEAVGASSYVDAVRCLGTAAYTLFAVPGHDTLHTQVTKEVEFDQPAPLEIPTTEVVSQINERILPKVDMGALPSPDRPTLTRLAGVLIQFTDYTPRLHNVSVDYERVVDLREAVQKRADEGPIGLAEQLDAALEQSDGDITDALWHLFITSRQHARWLDSSVMRGMHDYTQDEKVGLMKDWNDSIVAFKERRPGFPQDAGGDTYYVWTHALAKLAFAAMPDKESIATRAATKIFHHGTTIMHALVHRIANTQDVKSNHTAAAVYGNAIGQTLVDAAKAAR